MNANERWVLFLLIVFVVTLAVVGGMIHRDHEERLEKLEGAMQTEAPGSGQAPGAESRAVPVAPSSTDGKGGDAHRGPSDRSAVQLTMPRPEANAPRRGYTPEQALALHEACVHLVELLDGTHEHGDGTCAIWISRRRWEFAWPEWRVTLEGRED